VVDGQHATAASIGGQDDDIEVRLEAALGNLPLVRSIAVNIAMRADFDVDSISDLELAVDESCSVLITRARPASTLLCRFTLSEDQIVFHAEVASPEPTPPSTSAFGWRVLSTLTDRVRCWVNGHEEHRVLCLELVKRRPVLSG
jgi:serine/threonine-protein kinase RsbW